MTRPALHLCLQQIQKQPFLLLGLLERNHTRCFSKTTTENSTQPPAPPKSPLQAADDKGSFSASSQQPKPAQPQQSSTSISDNNNNSQQQQQQQRLLQTRLTRLQSILEESSGLTELVHLKTQVQEASDRFDHATQTMSQARTTVEAAQLAHEQAHKKHVSLLMRRDEWNAEDAQSFVTVTGSEVQARHALVEAQSALKHSEQSASQCQHAYMDAMRRRYHEEQLWQDKWRLLGTYGTWSLIGLNTVVFVGGHYMAQQREQGRMHHMEEIVVSMTAASAATATTTATTTTATNSTGTVHVQKDKDDKETSETMDKNTADDTATEDTQVSDQVGRAVEDESQQQQQHEGNKKSESPWLQRLGATRSKLSQLLQETMQHLHTPSVALGAVAGASCVMVVSLLLVAPSRR